MTSLTTLEISGTRINGKIPASLGLMSTLSTVVLTLNRLSCELPRKVTNAWNKQRRHKINVLTGNAFACSKGVWAAAFGQSVLAVDEGDAFYICGDSSFALVLVVALVSGIPFVLFSCVVRASPRGNWWRSWQWDEANFGDNFGNDVLAAFKNLELLLQGHVLIAVVGEFGSTDYELATLDNSHN